MNAVLQQPVTPSRRAFLRGVGGALAVAAVMPGSEVSATPTRLNIALADQAVGLRGGLMAFDLARSIGATGVEIDFGRLGNRSGLVTRLMTTEGRQHVMDAADGSGRTISSIAMGLWNEQSFADHPKAIEYTIDAIQSAETLGVKVITLPIAHAEDLAIVEIRNRCIANLKAVSDAAEAAGVTLAMNVALPPAELKRLLNDVGSPAVVVAIAATSVECVSDTFEMIGHHIAQVRLSFNESTTQAQQLAALRDVCNSASWAGWVVIDRLAASPDDLQAVGTRAVAALSGALTANYS